MAMTRALVLLCGGLSTRMGYDKTFLPFGGRSLLEYQTERFRTCFSNIYLSVPARSERPVDYTARCGFPVIEDLYSRIGPMGGLYSAMKTVREDILFFTSIDAPFTDPALAVSLCDRLESEICTLKSPVHDMQPLICTVKSPAHGIQPLFCAYSRDCLPRIEDLIEKGEYRLRLLFDEESVIIEDQFLPEEQFFNMNDPKKYYYALQRLAGRSPGEFPPDFAASRGGKIPVISFTAKSGTGKTTYLEHLIPLLKHEGLRIAVVKHDAHGFEIDKPGKDSYRLTHAGADHMILTSKDQTVAVITHRGLSQDMDSILTRVQNADLIVTEGYKLGDQKKIHILRKGYCETPAGSMTNVIAWVCDFPFESDQPVFDLNRPEDIVPFLVQLIQDS